MTLPANQPKTAVHRAAVILFAAGLAGIAGSGAMGARPFGPVAAAARELLVPLSPYTSYTNAPSGSIGSPALSADASRIAFLHCYDPEGLNPLGRPQLFLAGVDDSTVRQVTVSDSLRNPAGPAFSLDGQYLYFTAEIAASGVRELFRAAVSGGEPQRLTFQTAATGFAPIGRPAALGPAGACFSSVSDLLQENLNLGSTARNIYRVGAAGNLERVTSPDLDLLRNAEVLAGSIEGNRLIYSAEDPLLSHARPFRPLLLDVNTHLELPLTPDIGAGAVQAAPTPFGSRFVFSSNADYLGRTTTGSSQLFRVPATGDSVARDSLEQLTEVQFTGASGAAADSSGNVVAFESAASVLFNETTGTWRVYCGSGEQISRLSTGRSPNVSAGGARIAYVDNSDSLGMNADHSPEIFSVRPDGTDRRQHSRFVTGVSESPDISTDGAWVVFTSTGDLTGENIDGNREIFVVRSDGSGLKQLTHTLPDRDNREPRLSADGSFIVFASNADLIPGKNPDGNYEIFRCLNDGTGLEQITTTTSGGSGKPSISSAGDAIAFVSTANLGGGTFMNQGRVAVWRPGGSFLLVTPSSDREIEVLEMSDDGERIAILSPGNIGGVNPSHWRRVFTVGTGGGAVSTPAVPGIVQPGSLAMSPDGGWLTTAAQDGFVRLFPYGGGEVDTLFGETGLSPVYPGVSTEARYVLFSVLAPWGDYRPGDSYVLERGQSQPIALIGTTAASAAKPGRISGDASRVALVMTGPDSLNPDGSTEVFAARLGTTAVSLESFTATRRGAGAVVVRWTATSDGEHLFFRVSRAERRDGLFETVSDPVAGRGPRYEFTDTGAPAAECWYRLDAVERSGRVQRFGPIRASDSGGVSAPRLKVRRVPGQFPFVVSLEMPYAARASLCLFDVAGRLVRRLLDDVAPAGMTEIPWDGRNEQGMKVASGAYFLRLNRQPATVVVLTR